MWVKRVSKSGGIPAMRDEKRENLIQDALNMLDDELILEADEKREKSVNTMVKRSSSEKNNRIWRYATSIAASVAVFLIAGVVWNEVIVPNQATEGSIAESQIENEKLADADRGQNINDVTFDHPEGTDSLNFTPDIIEVETAESQSLKLQDGEQIHLPNQEVKLESVASVEELIRVKIPAVEVLLTQPNDMQVDMLAFFIYEGRCYVQDMYYKEGLSLVGDYVGTSVGLIDEWTKEDGYVDFAGSISGKFYEVKGYDPEFILCMKFDDGAVETFINNNGISLGKGSEVIEDRLHLNGNVEKVSFKTHKEWNESLSNEKHHFLSEEYDELIERFLESFSSDNFVQITDTPLDKNRSYSYMSNDKNYHLTFYTKDGLQFEFVLYEDGYCSYRGLNSVCVQIDLSLYEEMLTVFKAEL